MMPVELNVSGKRCVIIGGGEAAWRKAKTLIENGADVTVVCEALSAKFDGMGVEHVKKKYSEEDVKNSFLVVAATDDAELNRRIRTDAENGNAKLFLSSDGEGSDLAFMAYAQSGDVKIAVSTGGAYPLLGAKIRDSLSGLCEDIGKKAAELRRCRQRILGSGLSRGEKRELLCSLISDEMIKSDIESFKENAEKILEDRL